MSFPRLLRPAVPVLLLLTALAGCGEDESGTEAAGGCAYEEQDRAPSRDVTPPAGSPTRSGEVPVTIATSVGDLTATLDADTAPCTVESLLSLAEQGYYDDTECHRLTTAGIFVLQCGDPDGNGTGGPGYNIPDELEGAADGYPAGTLAMANTGQPDTGGSQFFLVHEDTELPPDYTVFGTLDEASLEIVREVAADGTTTGGPDAPPATPVTISSITEG